MYQFTWPPADNAIDRTAVNAQLSPPSFCRPGFAYVGRYVEIDDSCFKIAGD
jgi:hypothetical protein